MQPEKTKSISFVMVLLFSRIPPDFSTDAFKQTMLAHNCMSVTSLNAK